MKLEDAQQTLYKTSCDMDGRRYFPPATPRPKLEKCWQGLLIVIGLIILIFGPLVYFSTANGLLQPNLVHSSTLTVSINTNDATHGTSTMELYNSDQQQIAKMEQPDLLTFLSEPSNAQIKS